MSSGHEHNGGQHDHSHHGPRVLPASLAAPEILSAWRMRALIVFAVATVVSLVAFSWSHEGRNHILRAYLLGYMICFTFAGGGLAMLMLQYVSGGKWGLLLRRPLEAMTRTIWLVGLMFVPIIFLWKHLYQWAAFPTAGAVAQALSNHAVSLEQAMTLNAKRAMLNPAAAIFQTVVIFAILGTFVFLLNKWSLQRDADPERGTEPSFDRWRVKFENLSGIGILIYVILLTDGAIVWIKSLDITWYSSIWGLQFLVGQGYAVLALSILTVILLSRFEPMKTMLRATEQHDLGKLAFAFVMLNIYLCFAEFLIIWSGNVPDEIPWYLNRIHGGWWYVCSADFICHWLIPFCLLLSRDLKRNKQKMIWLTCFMIFARCLDMFWLIEPNFADAAGNLHLTNNVGILAYITVPVAVISLWSWIYMRELQARPLLNVNDPHVEEMLEPEHAH
ncbi:hypothetical protein [Tunturibacter empetritectus]|uniref:Quinol:cytochrome c oxidoreductase quinone-binding subunit 2 n=1 Tax=Tunturiibacter empetritectus TaxID=3069691 RepID=A0A7W8ILJ1_9BACT|nr:hypothetical protein [Edaphobacter lichenicola]MBB5318561.1 hypothetical protein [Edaphobacter lichenicola]